MKDVGLTSDVLQYVQIGLALMIAWLVWRNGENQHTVLNEKHEKILELLEKGCKLQPP